RMLVNLAAVLGGSKSMLALSVIIVATLIAASTGIIGATIVMLGLIALPALLNAGVPRRMASGLVCASGTLGQIIPPSIVLILLGDQISNAYIEAQRAAGNFAPDPVSVGDLFAGALLPGLVLVALYSIYVVGRLSFASEPISDQPVMESQVPMVDGSVWQLLKDALPPILLIIAVLGSILMGVATPTEAAAVGVCGALLLAATVLAEDSKVVVRLMQGAALAAFGLVVLKSFSRVKLDVTSAGGGLSPATIVAIVLVTILLCGLVCAAVVLWRKTVLNQVLASTVEISAMIFGIIIAASMLSLVFRGFGGDEVAHAVLTSVPGGQWGILFATMLLIFALGFVLEFVEIVFIVIPIIGPVLLATDFHPVWFAILVALNLQTSFLTPPFGFSLFYFRSVAPDSISTVDIYFSIIPFVVIQLITLAIVIAFPGLATWLPSVLFG
ncbi:MAG: TRAP transporter large permease subunit, partial [Pseudomonadota bacterium]